MLGHDQHWDCEPSSWERHRERSITQGIAATDEVTQADYESRTNDAETCAILYEYSDVDPAILQAVSAPLADAQALSSSLSAEALIVSQRRNVDFYMVSSSMILVSHDTNFRKDTLPA